MNNIRLAVVVSKNEDTNQVTSGSCAFRWQDVMGMEDAAGSTWEYEKPRTWVWVGYKEFYIEGEFDEVFKEWTDWLAANNTQLVFSRQ